MTNHKRQQIFDEVKKKANGTVLSFEDRGPWGQSSYRGNFSGWIPAALIYQYGAESVAEIFAGGGTTSDLCRDLDIPYVGIDLNPNPVRDNIISMDILDKNAELPDGFYNADLQILHPPYPCINGIHYSNSMWKGNEALQRSDIQEMTWDEGMFAINQALMKGFVAMPKGSYQAVVVGDVRRKVDGKSVFKSMLADLSIPGELSQILVKMQHNTVSGRNSNFSSNRRNFFLIEHEFIVVVKKPSGYEIACVVPKKYSMDVRDSIGTATWKDVVYAVLQNIGHSSTLEEIYEQIDGHKKAENNKDNWKAKVRQTLQQLQSAGLAKNVERGVWAAA